jgi:protein TonB
MTAAVIRPPQQALFRNLIASKPERAESSFTATALSLVFHVSLVGALIWASAEMKRIVAPPVETEPSVFIPVSPDIAPQPAAASAPAPSVMPSATIAPAPALTAPVDIPTDIPPVTGNEPVFAEPGEGTTSSPVSSGTGSSSGSNDTFITPNAVTELPALVNAPAVKKALERNYPALLRDAGIGGKAVLWVYINEAGSVVKAVVKESSGQEALDAAALKVADIMKFSPAKVRENAVKVVVSVPVVFTTR